MGKVKIIFIFLLFTFFVAHICEAQGIKIGSNSRLIVSGNPTIEIRNGSFINNGIFQAGSGTVLFSGDAISNTILIGGTSVTSFYDLEIKKQQNGITLNRNININHSLILRRGDLILNSFTIDLGTNGVLDNENELSRVTELNTANPGGKILATAILNNPNAANPGNLGVYITSIENLGNTVIMRGHTRQLASPFDGIYRYYDFIPQNNTKLAATLRFSYLDADDVDHYENVYQQFVSLNNGTSWQLKGLTLRETNLNYIENSGYDTLGRVTLAHEDVQLSTGQIADSICAGTNVLVPFQTGLSHDTSNTFIAQLSSDKGSFASPIVIGTLHGTSSGSINTTIPLNTISGSGYRIRVVSTSPNVEGTNNNADIVIKPALLYYADFDLDGYGLSSNSTYLCEPNGVYTTLINGDCNDNDPSITSAIVYYADHDGDGHGNGGQGNITLNEGFDDFPAAISTGGWVVNNVSNPIGPFTWFQGFSNFFSASSGAPNSYVHVNYKSGSGVSTIRNWLITPEVSLANGSVFKFKTRNIYYPAQYPDRLQVRMSTSGSSVNIGSPNDPQTGDFATLLLDINETLSPTGYPGAWTEYTITVTGLNGVQSGRFAFYYYVPNGGPGGINSSTIGIDDVVYSEVGPDIFADCTPPPPGFVTTNDDCDDANALVYPGAIEYCNGIDDNCDGIAEDNLAPTFFNLEAHYSLDINVQDLTANNHDGLVYSNTIFPSPGVCNSPSFLSFNAGSNVRIPRSVEDNFTVSFWVKTSQVAPSGVNWYSGISLVDAEVCGNTDDWGISLIDGGKICFGIGSSTSDLTIKSTASYNNGAWHHIAATRNKSTGEIKLYVDNVLAATGLSTNTNSLNAPAYIGLGKNNCTAGNFMGALDEIQLYSRVLNSLEVTVLATCFSNAAFYPDQDSDGYGDGTGVVSINEGFDNVAALSSAGWAFENLSWPVGPFGYRQGNPAIFNSSNGLTNSFVSVNYQSGSGLATISNWMITPEINIQDGARFTFKTRTVFPYVYPDRLQVRLSTDGGSTNVGSLASSVGDFTTLLIDINPTLNLTSYPAAWVQYTVTISGQPIPTTGRIAFRYYVPNGGPSGANSNYIGIDDVVYSEANSPLTACEQPLGYVLNNYDCNDADASINPPATEMSCNGIDENCNGVVDDNNALHFDGTNDLVLGTNPNLPQGNSPRTIEAWINPSTAQNGSIFNWGSSTVNNQRFGILYISGKLYFVGQGNDLTGVATLALNTWTHVAATFDGSSLKLYVNGVLDASATKSLNTIGNTFAIGVSSPPSTIQYFNGAIDEIRVWNVSRTAVEIQNSMRSYLNIPQANLIAYYQFDQGLSNNINAGYNELPDVSGSLANGVASNFNLIGINSNWVEGVKSTWYRDSDSDLYGDINSILYDFCQPSGYTLTAGDCNDNVAAINPAHYEACGNGIDDNCNNIVDENNALAFDGVNDYVSIPTATTSSTDVTIETWVKKSSVTSGLKAIYTSNGFPFGSIHLQYVNSSLQFSVSGNNPVDVVVATITENVWQHLAVVYSSSTKTVKGYVNGILVSTNNYITAQVPQCAVGRLGSWDGTTGRTLLGTMDEFKLWNVSRTQPEIQGSMINDLVTPQAGLLYYYKFDQGLPLGANASFTTLPDFSGNNKLGTLSNFALTTGNATSNWVAGVSTTSYQDNDGDGYGNPAVVLNGFCIPSGYVVNNTDCNDNNPLEYNNAPLVVTCVPDISLTLQDVAECNMFQSFNPPAIGSNCSIPNGGMSFDGINDYLVVPTTGIQTLSNYTIEFWYKANSSNGNVHVWEGSSTSDPSLEGSTGNLSFWVNNSSSVSTGTLTVGQWYHIACVYDGSNQEIYVNGVLKQSASVFSSTNFGANIFFASRLGNNRFFPGVLDEIRIWNIAKNQFEISSSMNIKMTGLETGLVRYFDLNDPIGLTNSIKDNSLNLVNAVLVNTNTQTSYAMGPPQIPLTGFVNSKTNTNNSTAFYSTGITPLTWTIRTHDTTITCTQLINIIPPIWYRDADNDGYGDPNDTLRSCTTPLGYITEEGDCNDNDPLLYAPTQYFEDLDMDGFGSSVVTYSCNSTPPPGMSSNSTDCDDFNWLYLDNDKDNYGVGTPVACGVLTSDDCNDNDINIYPGATEELCNYIDDNCNTQIDEGNNFALSILSSIDACGGFDNGSAVLQLTNGIGPFQLSIDTTWASSVINFSSQYSTYSNGWSQHDVLGAPNTFPAYGDIPSAWASSSQDDQREFLELGFGGSQFVTTILIYETYAPGAIDTVYVRDAQLGTWIPVYISTSLSIGNTSTILTIPVSYTNSIDAVRIAINSPVIPDWNEIDAVAILGNKGSIIGNTVYGLAPGVNTISISAGNGCRAEATISIGSGTSAVYYADVDNDTYGNPYDSLVSCTAPAGYVLNHDDCDDTNAAVYAQFVYYADADLDSYGAGPIVYTCSATPLPGFSVYNSDCNDNDNLINTPILYHLDRDNDGFGSSDSAGRIYYCSTVPPQGYLIDSTDCNDYLYSYLDADNDGLGSTTLSACGVFNNIDCNDNDSLLQEFSVYYVDADGDGLGNPMFDTTICSTTIPVGYIDNDLDCDDSNNAVLYSYTFYRDYDLDGYGDINNDTIVCTQVPPTGYLSDFLDCDDSSATLNLSQIYFADVDGDGYGDRNNVVSICSLVPPLGYLTDSTDCDDGNASIHISFYFYSDVDGDGFGTHPFVSSCSSTIPVGYVTNNDDCNDNELQFVDNDNDTFGSTTPAGCGVVNNYDCDDNNNAITVYFYYIDLDGDGFGSGGLLVSCDGNTPIGYAPNNDDCNDFSILHADNDNDGYGAIAPSACGIFDGSDCNDNDSLFSFYVYFEDLDGDGFGSTVYLRSCLLSPPMGYSADSIDCDDLSLMYVDLDGDGVGSGSPIPCGVIDGTDCNDNDSTVSVLVSFYIDVDGDGFGSIDSIQTVCSQESIPGFVRNDADCDDALILYFDNDNDGFGSNEIVACGVINSLDCDDQDSLVNPAAAEFLCNSIDDDCNGLVDEGNPLSINVGSITNATGPNFNGLINLNISGGNGVYQLINPLKWADSILSFSSQLGTALNTNSTLDLLGAPNVYPSYGNLAGAWSSFNPDDSREYVELGFSPHVDIAGVLAYETFKSGAIDTFYVRNASNQQWSIIYNDSIRPLPDTITPYSVIISHRDTLPFPVDAVRIALNSGDVFGANQIDAVGVVVNHGTITGNVISNMPSGTFSITLIDTTNKCPAEVVATIGFSGNHTWFKDQDGDGYGHSDSSLIASSQPLGYTLIMGDCNDANSNINPGVIDICSNGVDDNCNGQIDETCITWYLDNDSDTYGNPAVFIVSAFSPGTSYILMAGDCNDADNVINPSANEICSNLIDDNCDGQTDENCFNQSTFSIKVFIEGYYLGNGVMQAVLYNAGLSNNSSACDSVLIELRDPFSPTSIVASYSTILFTNGFANTAHSSSLSGNSFYIVVKPRNAIETWSKIPVTLGTNVFFDFTTP